MQWRVVRLVMMVLGATVAASANANDWGDLAVVSGTLGNNSNRLCLGAPDSMRPADIGCPSYAPSLSTAGHVSITGNVSANKFIGDGSGLTNLSVQGDRIVSDTHTVIVNQATGYVSLTTGGTTWGYVSAGWSYLANLFTSTVSSSLVSATNVSATYVDATRDGTVSATYGYFRYISGTDVYGSFTGDGSGLTGIGQGDRITSGTTNIIANQDSSLTFTTDGNARMIIDQNGRVGVGTVTPTMPLQVVGSMALGQPNVVGNLFMYAGNGSNYWAFQPPGASGLDLALGIYGTTNTSYFKIINPNGAAGLGVNTTSPTATLQVSGTFTVSNSSEAAHRPSFIVDSNGYTGLGITPTANTRLTVYGAVVSAVSISTLSLSPNMIVYPTSGRAGIALVANNSFLPPSDGTNPDQLETSAFGYYHPWTTTDARANYKVFRIYTGGESGATGTPAPVGTMRDRFYVRKDGGAFFENAVGISNTNPRAKLDVVGTISASDAIQVGTSALTCGAGIPGAMRYSSGNMQFCNGTSWTTLGSAGAATAASNTGAIQFNAANALAGDTTNLFWDDANNRLGVGTDVPASNLHVAMDGSPMLRISGAGTSLTNAAFLSLERYRGTNATPDYNIASDWLGVINFLGYTSERRIGASVRAYADDGWGTTGADSPGALAFLTTPDGSGTLQERVRITSAGNVGVGVGSPTATLQVSGTAIITSNTEVSGTLKVAGTGSEACNAGTYGTIRYNAAIEAFQMCRP